jgi:hypothetical protein
LFHGIFVPVIGPKLFRRAQTAVTETKQKKFMETKLILIAVLAATLGGAAGWLAPSHAVATVGNSSDRKVLYYACPMHPAIKYDHPGDCPICGMKLQPVYADELKKNAPAATPAGCCSTGTTQ